MTLSRSRLAARSASAQNARFAAIDFETADHGRDSACAVGVVIVEGTRVIERHSTLLKPPRKSFRFTGIHGITWDDVIDAPTFGDYWPTLAKLIRGVGFLAAHNAPFDQSVLHACCDKAGVERPVLPFRCTVKLAREAWNIFPTQLPTVCEHLGIELDHHDPLSDALACARIVIEARRLRMKI